MTEAEGGGAEGIAKEHVRRGAHRPPSLLSSLQYPPSPSHSAALMAVRNSLPSDASYVFWKLKVAVPRRSTAAGGVFTGATASLGM